MSKTTKLFLYIFAAAVISAIAAYFFLEQQTSINEPHKKPFEESTPYLAQDHIELNQTLPSDDQNNTIVENSPIVAQQKILAHNTQTKLVLIIDDITNQQQIDTINALGYPVNISILPPSGNHQNSAQIVENLSNYMIHLPLEAYNFPLNEDGVLQTTDTYETIENTISRIKKLYPKAKYINNHTGSKFSEDDNATKKLMKAVAKYKFSFVDSRTIANSKLCENAKIYGVRCFSRNIFLDNTQNYHYIKTQLQKAVNLSKRNGFAIAIGHPYPETMQVLQNEKKLFDNVKLLYIESL